MRSLPNCFQPSHHSRKIACRHLAQGSLNAGSVKKEDEDQDKGHVDEIMLIDPLNKSKAWVYLCAFPSQPPLSTQDYVTYIVDENRVVSQDPELGFSTTVPKSWEHLSFRGMPNMLDRLKIRFKVKVIGMQLYRDETRFISKLISYKDGPIRVIRRVRNSSKIKNNFKTPSAICETIYYKNTIVTPYRIKVPINLNALSKVLGIGEIKVRGDVEMQNLFGWRLRNTIDSHWLYINGKMDKTELNVAKEGMETDYLNMLDNPFETVVKGQRRDSA